MAEKLSITKRQAKLGKFNPRPEHHGDEDVGAADIPLSKIFLERDEINELCGDEYAFRALFNTRGRVVEPMFPQLVPFRFKAKYIGCGVTLFVGLDNTQIKLSKVKLKDIEFECRTGGTIEVSLLVQSNPTPEDVALLYTFMGKDISASVRFGKIEVKESGQAKLPLGEKGDEDPDVVKGPLDERPPAS